MLKPTSLTNVRINEMVKQKKEFNENADDALFTMMSVISNLSKEEQTPESIKVVADAMQETYYNKFSSNDIIYDATVAPEGTDPKYILTDDSMFINVANGLPSDLTYVDIAGVRRSFDQICKISIGYNAFVHTPMWKIVDGVLKVAAPWMYAGADSETGVVDVIAGGIKYSVNVFDPVDGSKKLSVASVTVEQKEGCVGEASFEGTKINVRLGHHGQAVMVVLNAGDTPITDVSQQIFTLHDNGNVSIVTPESYAGVDATYVIYLFPYENRPVTEDENGDHRTNVLRLVIPGHGSIVLEFNATQIAGPTV